MHTRNKRKRCDESQIKCMKLLVSMHRPREMKIRMESGMEEYHESMKLIIKIL